MTTSSRSAAALGLPISTPSVDRSMPRRGFLAGLATLPLIGGSVTLLGRPIAAADAVTPDLMLNYNAWLWGEHCRCAQELDGRFGISDARFRHVINPGSAFHSEPEWGWKSRSAPASTRAAVVLAAVGCDWREEA